MELHNNQENAVLKTKRKGWQEITNMLLRALGSLGLSLVIDIKWEFRV